MLLTFDELGGTATVARWLDVVEAFQTSLDSMMSITHAAQMFGENRFLNVTYAAEAFHRVTVGGGYVPDDVYALMLEEIVAATPVEHHEWVRDKLEYGNQPTLRKRLSELAGNAGKAVRPLIGDKGKWAFAVSQVRNRLTHLGDDGKTSGADLRHLAESVYAVTRVSMLLEAGVPITVLEAKAESDNMTWYRDQLHGAISRARSKSKD